MTVISVEHISKAYRLGMIGGATLQEDVERLWAKVRGRPDPLLKIGHEHHNRRVGEHFWALEDISFQVRKGEVLGIIGRNGAGKSTLLKILSQVTAPTAGQIRIRGRIASLLEVGTGFHPELTGRENIFLNGAILGMNKAEIRRKMDEIIAFSGIEEFIDTPVKRYSSGMNVRLAFAVAAHLEPEILVVDEVLAVGDAAFQKKCIGKMGDVAETGRTILFVSHDLAAVSRLCQRGVLLNGGRIEEAGDMASVIATYTADDTRGTEGFSDLSRRAERTGTGDAEFQSIELLSRFGRAGVFEFGSAFRVQFVVDVRKNLRSLSASVIVCTSDGLPVHDMQNRDAHCAWTADAGAHSLIVTVPRLRLYPGDYIVDLWVGNDQNVRVDYVRDAIRFRVVQTPDAGIPRTLDRRNGIVFEASEWSHTLLQPQSTHARPVPMAGGLAGA